MERSLDFKYLTLDIDLYFVLYTHPLKKGLDKKINIRLSTPVFIGTLQTLCFYKIIEICSENRVQKVAKGIS